MIGTGFKMVKHSSCIKHQHFTKCGNLSSVSVTNENHFWKDYIQKRLMDLQPHLLPCPVEILTGDFHNKMYYINMKQELHFNVTFVLKPGTEAFPYVTVSNPHALGFRARLMQDGYTYGGNVKFGMQIILLQQHISGMAWLLECLPSLWMSTTKAYSALTASIDSSYCNGLPTFLNI